MNARISSLVGCILSAVVMVGIMTGLAAWTSTAPVVSSATLEADAVIPDEDSFPAINTTLAITANCRYGVVAWEPYLSWLGTQETGIGWHLNFESSSAPVRLPGAEYAQSINLQQDKDANGNYLNSYRVWPALTSGELGAVLANQPGSLWLVGNEPDRGPNVPTDTNRVQDDTYPQIYARGYHDVYQYIKAHDPTAQVAVAGLVEVTPGRLQYLDLMWQAYLNMYGAPMPVDVWNIHLYVLPEANHDGTAPNEVASVALGTDISIAKRESTYILGDTQWCFNPRYYCVAQHDDMPTFMQQVTDMRDWMKAHGQQNKALILSEYGILYPNDPVPGNPGGCWVFDEYGNCFTLPRTAQYLTRTFNYLNSAANPSTGYPLDNNRLVQQWLWFSTNYPLGYVSNIITPTYSPTMTTPFTFTQVGQAFRASGLALPQIVNLFTTRTMLDSLQIVGSQMTLTVKVGIMNNGSIAPNSPATVRVYADAARTQVLGSGLLKDAPGCARRENFAYISWVVPATTTGRLDYWVAVDPDNAIAETSKSDNFIQGSLMLNPSQLFLPLIRR